jgi:hypothetical protein
MEKPQAPRNLFVNLTQNFAVVIWDKVTKDLDGNYTTITAYYVYRTMNPSLKENSWQFLKRITSEDEFNDKDVCFIDFNAENKNYLYRVCPENEVGIGPCAISYGIIGSSEPVALDNYLIWNKTKWNQKLWK